MTTSISDLVYADAGNTRINMTVNVDGDVFPFTYDPTDNEGLTPVIRDMLASYSDPVASYVPAPMPMLPITARQIRLALSGAGLLAQTETAIAGLQGPEGEVARIEWEYATTYERTNPLLLQIGAALSLTEEQINTLWLTAMSL